MVRLDSTWSKAWLNARAWTQGAKGAEGAGAKLTHGGAQIPASWIHLDPVKFAFSNWS